MKSSRSIPASAPAVSCVWNSFPKQPSIHVSVQLSLTKRDGPWPQSEQLSGYFYLGSHRICPLHLPIFDSLLLAQSLPSPVSKSHIQWQLGAGGPRGRQHSIRFWGQTWSCVQILPLPPVILHIYFTLGASASFVIPWGSYLLHGIIMRLWAVKSLEFHTKVLVCSQQALSRSSALSPGSRIQRMNRSAPHPQVQQMQNKRTGHSADFLTAFSPSVPFSLSPPISSP